MAHLIPKDAVLAEIERRKYFNETLNAHSRLDECNAILSFIDPLEVKEVDLEKEYKEFVEKDPVYNQLVNGIVGKAIAKHFFELGMAVSSKAQKGE